MITAIMITRNDSDCLVEVLEQYKEMNIPLIVLDGSDDDGKTLEILRSYDNITIIDQEDKSKSNNSFMIQIVLDEKRKLFGIDDYVIVAFSDELWYHNPLKVIAKARSEQADYVMTNCMQHFFHKSQQEDYLTGKLDLTLPLLRRLPYYCKGWGRMIFFDKGIYNYTHPQFGIPYKISELKCLSVNPILSHFPMRTPEQFISHAKDRVLRGHNECFRAWIEAKPEDIFFETAPAGDILDKTVYKFNGRFDNQFEEGLEDLR